MVHSCRGGKMAGKKVNGAALEAFLKLLCVVLSGLGLESLCMYVCFDARRSLTGTNHGSQVHVSSSPPSCYFLVRFCLPAHCMALLVCGETLMMGRRVELWMASKSSAWETVLQCDSLGIFVSASCHVVMLSSNDCWKDCDARIKGTQRDAIILNDNGCSSSPGQRSNTLPCKKTNYRHWYVHSTQILIALFCTVA